MTTAGLVALAVGLGVFLFGAAFVWMGIRQTGAAGRFNAGAHQAEAEVTDVRWKQVNVSSDSDLLAFPVFRFTLPDGREVEAESRIGRSPPAAKKGERKLVSYRPDDPTRVQLTSGSGAVGSMISAVFIGLGAVFALMGLATVAITVAVVAS